MSSQAGAICVLSSVTVLSVKTFTRWGGGVQAFSDYDNPSFHSRLSPTLLSWHWRTVCTQHATYEVHFFPVEKETGTDYKHQYCKL